MTGHDQFVYMAAYGAKLAAKNALDGDSLVYDNRPCHRSCSPIRRWQASSSHKSKAGQQGMRWRPQSGHSTVMPALIAKTALRMLSAPPVEELGDTIFPYLSTVEGLKLAARAISRDVKMLSYCAG